MRKQSIIFQSALYSIKNKHKEEFNNYIKDKIREFLDKNCPVTSDGYYMVFINKKQLEDEE